RAVVWLGVPFGLVVLGLATWALPESRESHGRRLDPRGQLLAALALASLVLAVIERGHVAIVCIGICLVAVFGFLRVERRAGAAAMVPLALLCNRRLVVAVAVAAAMTFGMYGVIFLLPLIWLKTGALNVLEAGIALLPMSLVFGCFRGGPGAGADGSGRAG